MKNHSVTITKQRGGFIVKTSPGKNGAEDHIHVVNNLPGVEKLIIQHMDQVLANDFDGVANRFPSGKIKKD